MIETAKRFLRLLRPLDAIATAGFVYAATPDYHRAYARGAALPSVLVAPFLLALAGNITSDARTKHEVAIAIVLYVSTLTTVIALRPNGALYICVLVTLSIAHAILAKRIALLGGAIGALSIALMTSWYQNTVGGRADHAVSDGFSALLFVGSFEALKAAADPHFSNESGRERCVVASTTFAWLGAIYTLIIALLITTHLPARILACATSAAFLWLGFRVRWKSDNVAGLLRPMKVALLVGIAAMYFE